jgi:anti-sigma factor RsiW
MGCDRENILLYVEGELAPDDAARLRAHVAGCASCRAALEQEQQLASALGGLDDLDFPADFAATTVTRARCDLTHAVTNTGERGRAVFIALALAGATLVLLWPTGVLDPIRRMLGPAPCIVRWVVYSFKQAGLDALKVGRAVSLQVFERHGITLVALVALVALVGLLGFLLRRYHTRGIVGDGGPSR